MQMETYRHARKQPAGGGLNLDLTKAKSLQERIAKAAPEGRPAAKLLELEEKNARLIDLVQKIVEENRTIRKNFILVQESFEIVCDYNQKLASLVRSLRDRGELQKDDAARNATVVRFFRELLKSCAEEKWQPPSGERFLAKVLEGLQKFDEPPAREDDALESEARSLLRNRKCFSMFNTL